MPAIRNIVDRLPAYFLYDYAILGNFSLTTRKERFILSEYIINRNGDYDTPSHHFNQICKEVSFAKKSYTDLSLSYPYKSIPCKLPYAFYLDISKAYYQIASVYGMETVHREGKWMGFGTTEPDALFGTEKLLRALLVSGTSRKSSITEWKNRDLSSRQFSNRNYAPNVRFAIVATLHAIQSLVSPYSVYAHTDGFVIPYYHFELVGRLLDERKIKFSIKAEGITQIYGNGSYRIGKKRTRIYSNRHKPTGNIRSDFMGWWLNAWDRGQSYREDNHSDDKNNDISGSSVPDVHGIPQIAYPE